MIVWIVDDDTTGRRWVYSTREAAIEAVSDPEGMFCVTSINWRDAEPLFADLYLYDPDWEPREDEQVGSIWGIEVLD